MSMSKSSKMLNYINCRMKVTIQDSRCLVGTFMAFDRHMNLVLGDCEEFRRVKTKRGPGQSEEREEKRLLGLVLLRGENVVSLQVEAPAPAAPKTGGTGAGAGRGIAAGRGLGAMAAGMAAPRGLAGPVMGMGGPAPASMMPSAVAAQAQPQQYGAGIPRGMPPRGMMPPPGMGMMGMGRGMGMMPPGMPMGRGMPPGMPPRGMPPPS